MSDQERPSSDDLIRQARKGLSTESADHGVERGDEPDRTTEEEDQVLEDRAHPQGAIGESERGRREQLERSSDPGLDPSGAAVGDEITSEPNSLGESSGSRSSWVRSVSPRLLLVALLFGGTAIYSYFTDAKRDDTGNVVGAGEVDADDLRIGDCLLYPDDVDSTSGFEFASLDAVPCNEPHHAEVFGQQEQPAGPFPGPEGLFAKIDPYCADEFAAYVGLPVGEEARLVYSISHPDRAAWLTGERTVECLLEVYDGSLMTGSQKDQGRLGFGGLALGGCYDFMEASNHVWFTVTDCEEPHDLELFHSEELTHTLEEPYPGDDFIAGFAEETCRPAFAALDGVNALDYLWVSPEPSTWVNGDRLVQCLLIDPTGSKLVGSRA